MANPRTSNPHTSANQTTPANALVTGAPLAVVSIIFIAGAVLLILLTVLGGASDKNPLFKFYFLQADTSGIAGAAPVSRWTLWNVCSVQAGKNSCPGAHAATPLDPPKNFVGPDNGIPPQFIGYVNSSHGYG